MINETHNAGWTGGAEDSVGDALAASAAHADRVPGVDESGASRPGRTVATASSDWNTEHPLAERCDVLVTGGSGKLGAAIVDALLARGLAVRVLARRPPAHALPGKLEYAVGDLGDPSSVDRAVRGAGAVVHAGAAMSGEPSLMRRATVGGTRNVLDAMARHGAGRLVHVSSLSVVDWAGNDGGPPLTEDAADEPQAAQRGMYTQTKLEAEKLVRQAAGRVQTVILRPGQIWGGSLPLLSAAVCRRIGRVNLVLGDGRLTLPLVHVDDVVQAVIRSLDSDLPSGTVIQLVNPNMLTQNEVIQASGIGGFTLRLPRTLVLTLGWLSERMLSMIGRQSPIGVYRLRSALARVAFSSQRAQQLLGWQPHADERELMRQERRRTANP